MATENVDRMVADAEPWWRLAGKFLLAFFALQVLYAWSEGTAVERLVVDTITVGSAAWIIAHIDPASAALAIGHEIIAPCGSLSVLDGCEGSEAVLLLAAAMLAAPMSNGCRIAGLLTALPFVYLINQIRLAALFFSYCMARDMFALLHGYVAPTAIVIACCIFFLAWLQLCQARISNH